MPRPRKRINQEKFESLCVLHKKKAEICRELDIGNPRTLDSWVKDTYKCDFDTICEQKKEEGNTSLIENALEMSKKSAPVLIFLLKNWCGMTDAPAQEQKSLGVTEEMKEWFKKVQLDDEIVSETT